MTKYTTQQVQAGIKFLSNANVNLDVEYDGDERQVHFNIATAKGTRFWTSGDSIWSKQVQKGVLVKGISLLLRILTTVRMTIGAVDLLVTLDMTAVEKTARGMTVARKTREY